MESKHAAGSRSSISATRFIVIPEESLPLANSDPLIETIEEDTENPKKAKRVLNLTGGENPKAVPQSPAQPYLRNLIASSVKSHPIDEDTVEEISPMKPQDISLSLLRPETERLMEQHRQLIRSISEKPTMMRRPLKPAQGEGLAAASPAPVPPFRSSTSCLLPAPKPKPCALKSTSTPGEEPKRPPGPSTDEHLKAISLCFHSPLEEVRAVFGEAAGSLQRVKEHFIQKMAEKQRWMQAFE